MNIFSLLHQYLDCQLQQVQVEYYLQSLFITSVIDFEMFDMQTRMFNLRILQLYAINHLILQQNIKQKKIVQLILLWDRIYYFQQIKNIKPKSFLWSQFNRRLLKFQNVTFINNILHVCVQTIFKYPHNYLTPIVFSASLIQPTPIFLNSLYNSKNNIVFIKNQQSAILISSFYQNCQFNYQNIQPLLLWWFLESEYLSYQQIKSIFEVKPNAEVGLFQVENLEIMFCNIEQSIGFQGRALYIEAQRNSIILISQFQFKNISTLFSKYLGYVDLSIQMELKHKLLSYHSLN
ncbi:unnamed protein product [Paramecium primaurelia]|uniref:Uncharacterized protein n=1 Tax=Paramecium primaurelia TaxID=5886 RepID=A0A8S1N1W3_PARPR|nr:unnamed protein product [Paramecium primaurelia]